MGWDEGLWPAHAGEAGAIGNKTNFEMEERCIMTTPNLHTV
jgi:hypothetical protein